MATFRSLSIERATRSLGDQGPAQVKAAVDVTTGDQGKAVQPEGLYVVAALGVLIVGGVVGTRMYDHIGGVTFTAPEGVGIFALFYIIAQVIERVQEPLTPYLGTATEPGEANGKRKTQVEAKASLEKAVVESFTTAGTEQNVANKKRTVDQIRANLTVLMFGTSALLAMLFAGYLKARLLQTVGVAGIETWVDITVTGLVIGAGTKPLHDIITNIQEAKEEKQDPAETT